MNARTKLAGLAVTALLFFGGIASAAPPEPLPRPQAAGAEPHDIGRTNPVVGNDYTQLTTPCRLYDSRPSTPLGNNTFRTVSLAACPAVPNYATSLNVSLTATVPTRAGFTRVWAAGAPEPAQTVLQYGPYSTTTGAAVTVSASGLRLHNLNGPTDIIIDVAGYWSPPMYAEIYTGASTNVWSSTTMITAAALNAGVVGAVRVTFSRSIRYCDLQASGESPSVVASILQFGQPDNEAVLYTNDRGSGAAVSVFAYISVRC